MSELGESLVGRRLGDFELVEELGRGAMGVVYGGLELSTGRPVAVKVLAAELARDRALLRRFEREAAATAELDHPGIVTAFGFGTAEGLHYFAMELLSGESLEEILLDRFRLEPMEVASFGIQIARALGYAHDRGLLHRDVKPGNLMVDRTGRWAITDFGIALVEAETRLTRTGQSLGSPNYIAPEIVRGAAADGRSDLYSLGVVMFQALTGELPYRGPTAFAVLDQHLDGPVPRARSRDRAIPRELDRIVARLMAKDPSDRYATGEEVAAELLASTGGETPTLRPRAAMPRSESPRRGKRRVVWLGVGVIVAALYVLTRTACG